MLLTMKSTAGTMLAVDPMPASSSVSIGVWFPFGSRHESSSARGFMHGIEHMLFKGTLHRTSRELIRVFERSGGYVNAFTERSATCLHCTVPAGIWKDAAQTLLEMAFLSTFPEEEFVKEQSVILAEVLQTEDDPEEKSHEEFFLQFWKGQPISFPITGNAEQIQAMNRNLLHAYYLEALQPANALICVAGNLEAEACIRWLDDRLARISEERLKLIKPGLMSNSKPLVCQPATPSYFRTFRKTDTALAYVIMAIQELPPSSLREYLIRSTLGEITGGSSISRLFQILREEEGLCYTVFSSYSAESSEALWLFHMQTGEGELPIALDRLESVIDGLGSSLPSSMEFDDAISRLIGSLQLAEEDTDYRQRRMARGWLATSTMYSCDEELAQARSIRYDEVVWAAQNLAGLPRARYVFGALHKADLRKRGYVEQK